MTTPNLKPRDMPTAALSLHEQHALVPEMPPDQWKEFAADVKTHGVQESIKLIPGTRTIIDGRSRWKAATQAGHPSVPVVDADLGDESPVAYMLRVAIRRRHLTTGQRAAVGVELKRQLAKDARERRKAGAAKGAAVSAEKRNGSAAGLPVPVPESPQPAPPAKKDRKGEAREQAAAAVGVSAKTISTAERVAQKAPAKFEQVKAGTLSLGEAARQAGVLKQKPKAKDKPAADPIQPETQARGALVGGGAVTLLPCPFCRSADLKVLLGSFRLVQCQGCFATGPRRSAYGDGSEYEARQAWNERTKS